MPICNRSTRQPQLQTAGASCRPRFPFGALGLLGLLAASCANPNQWIADIWGGRTGTQQRASAPSFDQGSGIYRSAGLTVTITAAEPGASIYYTIDGSTPSTSSTSGPSPLTLSLPDGFAKAVRAMAASPTLQASPVVSATYLVDPVAATWAGGGSSLAAEGLDSSQLLLNTPAGIFLAPSGDLYVADPDDHVVLRVSGVTVHIVAGTPGSLGFSPNGVNAASALLDHPYGVAVDGAGNVYVADTYNHVVRRVNGSDGRLVTIAGGGSDSTTPTLLALNASFETPTALALDGSGRLYICVTGSNQVRRYDPTTAMLTTIAGDGSYPASPYDNAGDGGPATSAQLSMPQGIWVSPTGFPIFVADTNDNRIRRIDSNGIITTVAGTGGTTSLPTDTAGDGAQATLATFNSPQGLVMDGWGDLYISDLWDHRLRVVRPDGKIWTVAGSGSNGYSGDMLLSNSAFCLASLAGLAADASGRVFLSGSGRILCVPQHP